MSTRYITLESEELKELVEEKGRLTGQGRAYYEEMDRLQEDARDIASKIQVVKDKIIPLTAQLIDNEELTEYEVAGSTDITDEGELQVSVIDQLDEFKTQLKDKKKKKPPTREEAVDKMKNEVINHIQQVSSEDLPKVLKKILKIFK